MNDIAANLPRFRRQAFALDSDHAHPSIRNPLFDMIVREVRGAGREALPVDHAV